MSSAVARPMRSSSKKLTSSTSKSPWGNSGVWGSLPRNPSRLEGLAGELGPAGGRSQLSSRSVHDVVHRGRLVAGQVDTEVRRGALEVLVVGVAHLDRRTVA